MRADEHDQIASIVLPLVFALLGGALAWAGWDIPPGPGLGIMDGQKWGEIGIFWGGAIAFMGLAVAAVNLQNTIKPR